MAELDPVRTRVLMDSMPSVCAELDAMLADMWADVEADAVAAAAAAAPPVEEDVAPEPQAVVVTRPGDLWTLGRHRLLCGDCRDAAAWERLLGGERVDLLLTDPPYGISHPCDYKDRGRGKLAECRNYPNVHGDAEPFDPSALLALDVQTILWGGNWFASRLPDSGGWLVWDKDRPDDLDQSTCELAWTNCVKGVRRLKYLWNGMMREGNETLVHPTQKPVALMAWCIERCGDAKLIADPYCGSGTTIMACEALGRRCVACEIEGAYVDVCCRRFAAKTGEQAVRQDGVRFDDLQPAEVT
jgi:hypothetical protein